MLTDDGLFSLPLLTHTLDKEITQTGCVDGHVTYTVLDRYTSMFTCTPLWFRSIFKHT